MDHLAIMRQPYLSYIRLGKKPVESRMSINNHVPYGKVHKNDTIYFKQSGNFPIMLRAVVYSPEYFRETYNVQPVIKKYATQICIDDAYIALKSSARYLSLFWLEHVEIIAPITFHKRDMRPWIANFNVGETVVVEKVVEAC